MRGSRYQVAALLALSACGDDGDVTPVATSAPPTTAAPTTATPSATATITGLDGNFSISVKLVLADAAIAEESYATDHGTYTEDVDKLYAEGLDKEPGIAVEVVSASKSAYCLKATGKGVTLYFSSTVAKVSETPCS